MLASIIYNYGKFCDGFKSTLKLGAYDKREAFKEIQKHNDELLENDKIKQSNIPKCPTCGSSNIKRVSGTSKAVSVVMFGLLSQKVKKQFRCNNCGYEW